MARPAAFVVVLVVEVPVKEKPLALIVTVTPLPATALPKVSSTWTVGAGLMALPAVAVVGCWTKPTLVAAPGVMVKPLVVPLTGVPLMVTEAVMVGDPDWVSA